MSGRQLTNDNGETLEKVTTGDFSNGGLLNRQQFDSFFEEVQNQTVALPRVRFEPVSSDQSQIDKIGVGERLLRAATEATAGANNSPQTGNVKIDTEKVDLPWEVSMETVMETIEGEGTATTLRDLFAQQFGVDLEDLGFNGDEASADAFEQINDGWLKIAASRGAPSYDHANAAIDKSAFQSIRTAIDDKYKRSSNLVFIMSMNQKEEYQDYLSDRSTAAGDAMLMSGSEPTPYGYDVITPPAFPDDQIMFTDPRNLIYAVERGMTMRVTREGEAVVKRDLYAIYNMLAHVDYQVEDENAVGVVNNIAAP